MCSRYSLISPLEAVHAKFAYRDTLNFPIRYNMAPTQDIGVVCIDADGQRHLRMMRWGLLPQFQGSEGGVPMINARAEGISTKSAFWRAFAERRCLVPADGFYEWTGPKGGSPLPASSARSRPDRLCRDLGADREGGEIDTVAIITCDANATVASLLDRMPVVLGQKHFEVWRLQDDRGESSGPRAVAAGAGRSARGDRDASADQRFAPRRARHTTAAADAALAVS
jgi:putative SOS response-associated peptidase YedK